MAKIDKTKEEVGYFKVMLSLLIAIDVSIIAWVFQNSNSVSNIKMLFSILAIAFVSSGIFWINKVVWKKLITLEEL